VLRSPWQYVSQFSITDIAWLKQQDANLFCTVDTDDQNGSAKQSFIRIHSCIETVALAGVTELMVQLGDLARRDETPNSTPIDRWTLDLISRNVECEIPPNSKHERKNNHAFWKPDQIRTVSDYLHPTEWEVSPLLHIACLRTEPNMEMLKVLVEVCGVDVNDLTTRYCAESEHKEKQSYATTLQHLASSQCFWHLEAIRYLVYMGADVDARDKHGSTALHFACGSKGILSLRFVELLLELGADPKLANDDGLTSIDLATSPQKLQLLGQYGIDISKSENESLWLGVGELNIELVQMALDSGVDINRRQDSPVYTRKELEWDIHSTALSARCAAVPLAGALLYSDYLQVQESPAGEDLRAAMIRLLLDNGADPFQPYWTQKYHEDEQGRAELVTVEESPLLHYVFRAISCKKKYLELLLEYGDRLDFDRRDGQGNTVFLAACASYLRYLPPMAFRLEYSPTSDDAVDYEAEKIWDSGGLFLNMLDHGADITATNNDGDNALVSENPNCCLNMNTDTFLLTAYPTLQPLRS
jgi:ankyrin repeat protein